MDRYCLLIIVLISVVAFGGMLSAQEIDQRVWSMSYWQKLAEKGLVEVAKETTVPDAVYTGSQIVARTVLVDDSPDVPVINATDVTQSENSIFVNPLDNNKALNSNNSTPFPIAGIYGSSGFMTDDFGLTWGGSVQGTGGTNSGDPAACIDLTGRYYVGYIAANDGQGVAYSTNEGTTWTHVQCGPGGFILDKNHLWVDNSPASPYSGNLYSAWTNFQGGANDSEIEIVRSTNAGLTWSTPLNISSAVNAGSHNQGVNISTGPNGEVYVTWAIYDAFPTDETALGFTKSTDGGVTFQPAARIISNIRGIRTSETSKNHRVNSFPSMDTDISGGSRNGWTYIVWANIGVPGTNVGPDIDNYIIRSTNGGASWSTPVKINQDPSGLGKEHYFPWITCDPVTGNLSVISYDDRNVSSTMCEVFVANSLDGGTTWEDFKVSDVAFTPAPIPGLAGGYMGDYLGISARGGKVYPVWTDNRTGNALTYVSPFALADPTDPNPPENVSAYSDYTTPTSIALTWTDPTTLANGDTLLSSEFQINILRDNVSIDSVAGGTEQYTDNGLTDGVLYSYTLFTKIIANDSTSLEVNASWTAGGSPIPNRATAFSLTNVSGGDLMAHWINPSTNVDGTPMDDFDAIKLYEDGSLLTSFTRAPGDTGAADSALFTPGGINLPYYVTAVDNESPANESAASNTAYPPFIAPYSQDFEGATVGTPGILPVQWTNEGDDDHDWYVDAGGTPSASTGPTVDHTTGTATGKYMYVEASSPFYPNVTAHLTSPFIDLSTVSNPGMAFWYHMFGQSMGDLHVDVYANGVWNLDAMPPLIGQQQQNQTDPWLQAVVDLSAYAGTPIQVRFRGITGTNFYSDMAIDDVFFGSLDANPSMAVTPLTISDTLLVGASSMHTVTVSNVAILPTTMSYNVTENPVVSWLSVSPTSGTLASGQSDDLDVTLDATGLTAGTYDTELIVSGTDTTNLEDTVAVTLVVNNAPDIRIEPDSLFFTMGTDSIDSTSFTIFNDGLGPLNFTIADEDILQKNIRMRVVDRSYIKPEFKVEIPKGSPDWRRGPDQTEGAGGPDLFGYKWIDSDEPGGPTFNWIDISATGISVPCDINTVSKDGILGDDDYEGPFPLGFSFNYYGVNHTEFYIQSNGCIGFDDFEVTLTNQQIPVVDSYNNLIAWLWDDLDPGNPLSHVYYQTIGNTLVVQFDHYFEYPDGGNWVDAQIILYSSGTIKIQYDFFQPGFDQLSCTIGIENFDGTDGLQVVYNGAYLHDDLAIVFSSESDWLSANPISGTVPPGNSVDVWAIANSTGLLGGTYLANFIVNSNDPVDPTVNMPVAELTVIGAPDIAVEPDTVIFATPIVIGTQDSLGLTVYNNGNGVLDVTDIASSNPVFSVSATNFSVAAFDSASVVVGFTPASAGIQTGTLTITSNDPDTPTLVVPVEGEAVDAPAISVSPDTFDVSVAIDTTETDVMTIYNNGAGPLDFNIGISGDLPELMYYKFNEVGASQTENFAAPGSPVPAMANVLGDLSMGGTGLEGAALIGTGASSSTSYVDPGWITNISGSWTISLWLGGTWPTAISYLFGDITAQSFRCFTAGAAGVNGLLLRSPNGASYDVQLNNVGPGSAVVDYVYDDAALELRGYVNGVLMATVPQPAPIVLSGTAIFKIGGYTSSVGLGAGMLMDEWKWYTRAIDVESSRAEFWLSADTASGIIAPGDSMEINLTFDPSGLTGGDYNAEILVRSNDPVDPEVRIGVHMFVEDSVTSITELDPLPTTFAISQNYPNPFNPTTTFKYQLPEASDVKLIVYNILGQKVRTLINHSVEPGYHTAEWNGLNDSGNQVATGLYIYRFEAGNYVKTMKMMMLK